jgi:quercetin dioxygenase-like cupin family protein
MATPHATPGQVIDIRPLAQRLAGARTVTLVKTDGLEVIRLVLPAGKEIADHCAPGEITVQCLEGAVNCTALGRTLVLAPGEMLYLDERQVHALRAIEDPSLLLTIRLLK